MSTLQVALVAAVSLFTPALCFALMLAFARWGGPAWLAALRLVAWTCERLGRVRYIPERPRCTWCKLNPGVSPLGDHSCPVCDGRGTVAHAEPYITRYVLWGSGHKRDPKTGAYLEGRANVWLQRIHRPDGDRHPHDHPWTNAVGIVLHGAYRERRVAISPVPCGAHGMQPWIWRWLGLDERGRVNMLPHGVFHIIEEVEPDTWTLFLTGREHGNGWGFLVDGRHIPADEYLSAERPPSNGAHDGTGMLGIGDGRAVLDPWYQGAQGPKFQPAVLVTQSTPEELFTVPITWDDEPIPDTLRNDGQPDTEREPSTRRQSASPVCAGCGEPFDLVCACEDP